MSVILQPQVDFPIVRQIGNHLDSTTYYVRAVVRNASGATIDTVNLDAKGDQRYQTSWRVPADPSGQGAYISIVTSVYTDAGYTTKSPDYSDEENTYLIFDRVMPAMRGGGGIDARTVRRIMQEELGKLPEPEKVEFPDIKIPEVRFDNVLSAISDLRTALTPKPQKPVDLTPVTQAIDTLMDAIERKEVTPPTDLAPILERLNDKDENDDLTRQELVILLNQLEDRITNELPDKIATMLKETTFNIAPLTAKPDKKEKEEVFDISKITL